MRNPTHPIRSRATIVAAVALTCVLAFAQPALAAKGGGGKPGGGGPKGGTSSTIALVLLDSTDGAPHWGERITFDVSTTATEQPQVDVNCHQGGTLVYKTSTGYYESYPWPWTQVMTLESGAWTGGAADCVARLYYSGGRKIVTLATLGFHVEA